MVNLRGGIILNPIGAFNQNHDGPKWEFTDRPISSTQMLPATWSNAGFGLFGKTYKNDWMFGYELYLSGGFDNTIIDNEENEEIIHCARWGGNIQSGSICRYGRPCGDVRYYRHQPSLGSIIGNPASS